MKEILERLFGRETLSRSEAHAILKDIASGRYNTSQVASFLTVFRMRCLTVCELEGFRDALLELCLPVDLSAYDTVDLCGTGGDNKNTFNVSTISAFVVAGSGIKVAKHGNYGVSSICGSSNVLEELGVKFSGDEDALKSSLETAGICFLHAPLFHPAMKHVAPIRKELGVVTFFNILGPMVNPSRPKSQMVGVYSLELARLYSYLYEKGVVRYMIVHSLDGYDEISLTGSFKVIAPKFERLFEPEDIGLKSVSASEIRGGDSVSQAAKIVIDILSGQGSKAQSDVVIANAGLAIYSARPVVGLEAALSMARESLESKRALDCMKRVVGTI